MSDGCPGCMFGDLQAETLKEFPSYSLRWKADSRLMRAINAFLLFVTAGKMSSFMNDFITTIGFTVYVPTSWGQMGDISKSIVLRHERVHMRQRAKYGGFWFTFLYLFFPLPTVFAYFRMKFEREAYAETLRACVEYFPGEYERVKSSAYRERVLLHFMGAEYFWMWPFRRSNEAWYDEVLASLAPKA